MNQESQGFFVGRAIDLAYKILARTHVSREGTEEIGHLANELRKNLVQIPDDHDTSRMFIGYQDFSVGGELRPDHWLGLAERDLSRRVGAAVMDRDVSFLGDGK